MDRDIAKILNVLAPEEMAAIRREKWENAYEKISLEQFEEDFYCGGYNVVTPDGDIWTIKKYMKEYFKHLELL